MKKAIIYGVDTAGRAITHHLSAPGGGEKVIAFTDFYEKNWGRTLYDLPVIPPEKIAEYEYDIIIPAAGFSAMDKAPVIRDDLIKLYNVESEIIDMSYSAKIRLLQITARNIFLRSFSESAYKYNLSGNVAEGGVYRGEFSKLINECFPDRTLYLFDTFEGFDERDVIVEHNDKLSTYDTGYLSDTTLETAFAKLPHPEKVIVRKGYFPETAIGIDDQFVFVLLDFDLYNPILAGLEFFYPKLVAGGIILVHDYYADTCPGATKAVDEFCRKNNIVPKPIGDTLSILISKT
jgi:hypothetical protein